MKTKLIIWLVYMSAAMVGAVIGETMRRFFPRKQHLCECEMCKVKRQLETCEVLDSVFTSKIQIEINNK